MKNIYVEAPEAEREASLATIKKRAAMQPGGSKLPYHDPRHFLTGTLGKNLAFSPRCTLATFVLMDLIGSSPKSA
ncbi:hypothetical protein [Pseudomonas kilonensis]|uniref:Uncharacterized protein n=1 Tax=Pseudomonas kilonensis TaxID=132476 RepID=A0ABY0YFY8_9PSED|nr:hypothetical protein [Pseudomonas kilonensis]SED52500.1 hypothetical protein SAMN04490188_0651 [Pseudomonas kilonensis]